MAQAQVRWRGDRFFAQRMLPLVKRRFDRAGRTIRDQVRERVSEPHPPASRPGRPPRRRTGRLRRSITQEVTVSRRGVTARIRARAPYASALQRGTSKMAARPFLFLTRSQIQRLVRIIT